MSAIAPSIVIVMCAEPALSGPVEIASTRVSLSRCPPGSPDAAFEEDEAEDDEDEAAEPPMSSQAVSEPAVTASTATVASAERMRMWVSPRGRAVGWFHC